MTFHDPRREIEKLRDHLASHDKPILFLVGAGASCSVEDGSGDPLIPSVAVVGERCEESVRGLGKEHDEIYRAIKAEVGDVDAGRPTNVEDILSAVRLKIAAMAAEDRLAGGSRSQLEEVEAGIRQTIARAALPAEEDIPDLLPHHALARWVGRVARDSPIEVFTTNYDTLLERAFEDERVPVFDGFVGSRSPFFVAGSLEHAALAPGRGWARLWKIHGSVNWEWQQFRDGSRRIVRTREGKGGELILPSFHKYDESRKQPYVAMLDHLGRVLTKPANAVLIAIGYSFGDQHINDVLFDVLDAEPRVHAVALQFEDPPANHDLVKRAQRHQNLLVYGPGQAVIGGTVGDWKLIEPTDSGTAALLDVPFDSDAQPEGNQPALTGRFRLGDFCWFGRFLDGITGIDE